MPQSQQTIWTPANIVTVIRIIGVPIFVIALLGPWPDAFPDFPQLETAKPWIACAIFIILAATDSLDGYLARSRNEVTNFGKFVDPLADKILVAAALIALVELDILQAWVVIVIFAREFIVSGLRMIAATEGVVIAASWYGKAKTVFQIIVIIVFIIRDAIRPALTSDVNDIISIVAWAIMGVALILTIVSMLDYLVKSKELLGFGSKREVEVPEEILAFSAVSQELQEVATRVVEKATKKGMTIATAESLTGGLTSAAITSVPGSSSVIAGSFVSYTPEAKESLLAVPHALIEKHGVVSEEVACAMAEGARQALHVDVAISMTGIAGPTGAEPGKPVGTVYIGVSCADGTRAQRYQFGGSRDEVRINTAKEALLLAESCLS